MANRVAILMSTYNGERYLEEQIQSILKQTYSNIVLYIRDDGSTDDTIHIIRKYAEKNNNVIFFNEKSNKNIGVLKSFMTLLANVKADYYMFSDQDDIWLENKVASSLQLLKKNEERPTCVFTNAEIVDKKLDPLRSLNDGKVWTDFKSLLFANCVTGCTMAFNNKLREIVIKSDYQNIFLHDWWIALLAAKFGKLVYLNKKLMLYRQHGDNVVGGNEKNSPKQIYNRLSHIENEKLNVKHSIDFIAEFYNQYSSAFNGREKEYMARYAALKKKSSFMYNLLLVLRFPPARLNLKGRVFFSYLLVTHPAYYLK